MVNTNRKGVVNKLTLNPIGEKLRKQTIVLYYFDIMRIAAKPGSDLMNQPYLTMQERFLAFGVLSRYIDISTVEEVNLDLLERITDRRNALINPVPSDVRIFIEKTILGYFYKFSRQGRSKKNSEHLFSRKEFNKFCKKRNVKTRIRLTSENTIYEEIQKEMVMTTFDRENMFSSKKNMLFARKSLV